MATGKRFYWIKLRQDFMTGDTIDFLMSQKDGANYVVLYQMLCLMVANTNGSLCKQVGEVLIPYDIDRIKRDCKYFDRDTVIVAMELFKKLGLVYESDEGIMQITHFNDMVGSTSDYAEQKRNQRLGVDNVHSMSTKMSIQSKSIDIDIDKELDKDIELNKDNINNNKKNKIDYQLIADMYNVTCVSFPRLTTLSESRKKAIKARLKTYSIDDFKRLFTMAENSNFLKGSNDRNWSATFDWLIKDNNMAKVLDGNYDNRTNNNFNNQPQSVDIVDTWV